MSSDLSKIYSLNYEADCPADTVRTVVTWPLDLKRTTHFEAVFSVKMPHKINK